MIDNYMLYSNLPSIDLHGMNKVFAVIKVKEFILTLFFDIIINKEIKHEIYKIFNYTHSINFYIVCY